MTFFRVPPPVLEVEHERAPRATTPRPPATSPQVWFTALVDKTLDRLHDQDPSLSFVAPPALARRWFGASQGSFPVMINSPSGCVVGLLESRTNSAEYCRSRRSCELLWQVVGVFIDALLILSHGD
ncbi:hypothetical protein ACQPYE_10150 [Actinosynnema sp. CA-299493]